MRARSMTPAVLGAALLSLACGGLGGRGDVPDDTPQSVECHRSGGRRIVVATGEGDRRIRVLEQGEGPCAWDGQVLLELDDPLQSFAGASSTRFWVLDDGHGVHVWSTRKLEQQRTLPTCNEDGRLELVARGKKELFLTAYDLGLTSCIHKQMRGDIQADRDAACRGAAERCVRGFGEAPPEGVDATGLGEVEAGLCRQGSYDFDVVAPAVVDLATGGVRVDGRARLVVCGRG